MQTLNLTPTTEPATPARTKRQSLKGLYWTLTAVFAALMLLNGVSCWLPNPASHEVMRHLGYPMYLMVLLGVGKILGALALLQPWFKTIKEWACAGFVINFISAAASWAFVDKDLNTAALPLVALAILLAWKRKKHCVWG